jgi:pimeloyl-ACP methyl ester carboxylesterase
MRGVGVNGHIRGRAVAMAVVLGLAAIVARPVESLAASDVVPISAKVEPRGSVYLFLGLMNVFSTGLDTLSDELKAKRIANTAMNYSGWLGPAADIEKRWAKNRARTRPIVLIGHSFGADAAMAMAAHLGRDNIPVDLVVIFDATAHWSVTSNVRHVINFYGATDGIGKKLSPGKGFHGRLENINVDKLNGAIGHLDIEKQASFHKRVIREVLALYGRRS